MVKPHDYNQDNILIIIFLSTPFALTVDSDNFWAEEIAFPIFRGLFLVGYKNPCWFHVCYFMVPNHLSRLI